MLTLKKKTSEKKSSSACVKQCCLSGARNSNFPSMLKTDSSQQMMQNKLQRIAIEQQQQQQSRKVEGKPKPSKQKPKPFVLPTHDESEEESEKSEEFASTTSSTLSVHIAKYDCQGENPQQEMRIQQEIPEFLTAIKKMMSSEFEEIEFPRGKDDTPEYPEAMQFKASQLVQGAKRRTSLPHIFERQHPIPQPIQKPENVGCQDKPRLHHPQASPQLQQPKQYLLPQPQHPKFQPNLQRQQKLQHQEPDVKMQFLQEIFEFSVEDFKSIFDIVDALEPEQQLHRKMTSVFNEKFRYNDIPLVDATRYKSGNVRFIHANKVNSSSTYFLAAQGPLPNTVEDMFEMLQESETIVVIQLCKFIEMNIDKCYRYFDAENKVSFGQFEIAVKNNLHTTTFKKNMPQYSRRTLLLNKKQCKPVEIEHFLHESWPDHGQADDTDVVGKIIRQAIDAAKSTDARILVHCSAGVGRTGCLLLGWILYEKFGQNTKVDIGEEFKKLRSQRYGAVQGFYQFFYSICIFFDLLESDAKYSKYREWISRIKNKLINQNKIHNIQIAKKMEAKRMAKKNKEECQVQKDAKNR